MIKTSKTGAKTALILVVATAEIGLRPLKVKAKVGKSFEVVEPLDEPTYSKAVETKDLTSLGYNCFQPVTD